MKEQDHNNTRKMTIARKIKNSGFPVYCKGFITLIEVLNILYDEPHAKLIDDIYPRVAEMFDISRESVERNIRTGLRKSQYAHMQCREYFAEILWQVREELGEF